MNTNIFKTAIAALALLVAFNSCKEKEDDNTVPFPYDEVEFIIPDYAAIEVATIIPPYSLEDDFEQKNIDFEIEDFISTTNENVDVRIGTDKEDLHSYESLFWWSELEPNTKYYWFAGGYLVGEFKDYENTELRHLYTVSNSPTTDNGDGEIAVVLRWSDPEHKFKNVKVEMTPTIDCGFAGKTFDVPDGQDSLCIKLADNAEIPIKLNDFDDKNGKNYEPIIYSFQLIADIMVDEEVYHYCSKKQKEIFLNKRQHVRDHEFNVYRVVEVGGQYWLADDLRCKTHFKEDAYINGDYTYYNYDYMISELPSGAKGILYNAGELFATRFEYEQYIIDGYHIARVEDWQKLLKNYGVEQNMSDDGSIYYNPPATIPDLTDDFKKWDSIADIRYLKSLTLNLWNDIFASASDWVDSTGRNVYPTHSVFNIKPFGYGWKKNKEQYIKGQGIGAIYYADEAAYLISFYYGKDGVGYYPANWYSYHSGYNYGEDVHYYLPIRLVKDK
ncbi:MAG: hypothetical protein J6U13_00635 [Salinivirgaceae bacterium]|nr:hypothetical protein [Salinivirgaceae bacterium]